MKPAAPVPHLTHPKVLRRPRGLFGRVAESLFGLVSIPAMLAAALAVIFAASASMAVGVHVNTAARPGTGDTLRSPGARYLLAVLAERGDTVTPVRVRGMGDYVKEFGNRVAYGFGSDDLQAYFDRGGTEALVTRVVGDAATKGVYQLVDTTDDDTVLLTAFSEGAWSQDMTVAVTAGVRENTFTITLAYKAGTTDEIIETFRDLTDPADAVAKINGRSRLVTAEDSGSETAAPGNNPDLLEADAFSAGDDDRASVDADAMVAALDRFIEGYGPGAVAIPGYDLSLIGDGLKSHCKANIRVGLVHDVAADTIDGMETLAGTQYGSADSEWLCLVGPWIRLSDGVGGYRTIPPTGAVAALRSRAIQETGAWRWPVGDAGVLPKIIGTELDIDLATAASMIDAGVNPIRVIVGRGVELYGWRSLSNDSAYYSIAARDTLNQLAWSAAQRLEAYYGDPIDSKGETVGGIKSELDAMCEDMRVDGGLFERRDPDSGQVLDPGYVVEIVADPATRSITANIGVRITEAAELIVVNITKVATDQVF